MIIMKKTLNKKKESEKEHENETDRNISHC